RVRPERMQQNLDLTGGLIMAESAASALAPEMGRTEAHHLVTELCQRAVTSGTTLRTELRCEQRVRAVLSTSDIESATDPATHLGDTSDFIDTALHNHACQESP